MPVFGKSSSASSAASNPIPAVGATAAAPPPPPSGQVQRGQGLSTPSPPQGQTPSLFSAVLTAYLGLWKDALWMLKIVIFNPFLFVPMLIFWVIVGLAIGAAWLVVLSYGPMIVGAIALFVYLRSLDRFSLRLINKNVTTPPMPPEPKTVVAIYKAVGRPAPGPEGAFRHYYFRLAWWDFRTVFMDALASVIALGNPIIRRTAGSAGGGNILTRAITFPLLAMIGVLSILCLVAFVALSAAHLLAVILLTVAARFRTESSGDHSDVSGPRRLAGLATMAMWVVVPVALAAWQLVSAPSTSGRAPAPEPPVAVGETVAVVPRIAPTVEPPAAEPARPVDQAPPPSVESPAQPTLPSEPVAQTNRATAPAADSAPAAPARVAQPAASLSPSTPPRNVQAPVRAGAGDTRRQPQLPAPTPQAADPRRTVAPPTPDLPENAPSSRPQNEVASPVRPADPEPAKVEPSQVPATRQPPVALAYSGPSTGRLSYDGDPVPQNGEIAFRNLPPGNLELQYDRTAWSHRLAPERDGTQRLVLRSLKPGTQRRVAVVWSIAR
jgi:hypothetical protein